MSMCILMVGFIGRAQNEVLHDGASLCCPLFFLVSLFTMVEKQQKKKNQSNHCLLPSWYISLVLLTSLGPGLGSRLFSRCICGMQASKVIQPLEPKAHNFNLDPGKTTKNTSVNARE
ncbi:MAG: hypothetical protein BYD32DRAFT_89285 [Podila humilis]|nr:MAG: hypothetical protein BYD32DRAFT_89285 [Podila humilis]